MYHAASAFDETALNTIFRAYEGACAELAIVREEKTRRERLAEIIFQVARSGELGEAALVEEAVRRYSRTFG